MVSLLYLKHAFNESDESLVERWSENVQWQFFSGMAYYEPKLPCHPAQISRFRRVLGEAGVEQLLKTTIEAALTLFVRRCGKPRKASCALPRRDDQFGQAQIANLERSTVGTFEQALGITRLSGNLPT